MKIQDNVPREKCGNIKPENPWARYDRIDRGNSSHD